MAKELKNIILRELSKSFGDCESCVLIDFRGLNSEQTRDLRSSLSRSGVEMTVVQNRIAKRVFEGRGAPRPFQDLLRGPTAVLHGGEGAIPASKTLILWRKKNKDLASIRGGLFQGRVISASDVEKLATLPDAASLRSSCLAYFMSPLNHLASVTQSLLSHFPSAVRAHREGLEKGEAK